MTAQRRQNKAEDVALHLTIVYLKSQSNARDGEMSCGQTAKVWSFKERFAHNCHMFCIMHKKERFITAC